jgi:hypothetical protein
MSPKWRFILLHGEGWALFTMVGFLLLYRFWDHQPIDTSIVVTSLIVWPLGGLLFGQSMWERHQKQLARGKG